MLKEILGKTVAGEHLSRQEALAGLLMAGFGSVQRVAFFGCQPGAERIAEMGKHIGGDLLELSSVGLARGIGRRATAMATQVDHQREPGHVDGLLDPLTELRLDALDETARVVVLVGIGTRERRRAHETARPRRRPSRTLSGTRSAFMAEETCGISPES